MRSTACQHRVAALLALSVLAPLTARAGEVPLHARASIAPRRAVTLERARAAEAPAPPPDADRGRGIFGPLRIGPVVSVAFPRPLSIELLGVYGRTLGLGIEYSGLPAITIGGVNARAYGVAGDVRWFVLGSPFFLGAGVGVQSLSASGSSMGYQASVEASKVFVTPRLGVLWTFGAGFSVGADVGLEVPIAYSQTASPAIAEIENHELVVALTRRPLPEVHLARLGWLF